MYGKIFESIYDGTLCGHWQAIVTMQQMIVLANEDGIVDMTPNAIASRTSIPLDIIEKGLEHLAKPDPHSRTPGDDGRRIALIDDHRPWGWRLVNHAKYRGLRNLEQKREADRKRISDKRRKNKHVAIPSQGVADVAHTDTDTHTDTEANTGKDTVGRQAPDAAEPTAGNEQDQLRKLRKQALEVLGFLNEKAGKNYQPVKTNIDLIVARLREGGTAEDMRAIIAKKCREWRGRDGMEEFLRPATLFGAKNFWQKYQGELPPAETPK